MSDERDASFHQWISGVYHGVVCHCAECRHTRFEPGEPGHKTNVGDPNRKKR